ncbi:carboxymuconolactone decarboxylase family protein [Seongchinamella unica]|uniref:Carboxymuconolactone decarboxylase family protein n=1 Tax=Seongchinamella unica TaxID=2547392 RepID=A0A4R5LTJ7_9GAMM|nr:carboxymuconolactone decarboxylase family protein [Seongchinamella unica]TDG14684.1 carboxymuconolactone decarboxylase family protein [Seongchinamella unica]
MNTFKAHTVDTAPSDSHTALQSVKESIGLLPNVFAAIAESPLALETFVTLNGAFAESSLSPEEQQIVLLATSTENNCVYCVAGHTAFANQINMPQRDVDAMREMRPLEDEKLQALNKLVRQMVRGRGRVSETDIENFLAAGYSRQQFFEVIIGVCVKTFSNYVSIGLELELDAAFQTYAWEGRNAKATNQEYARQ